LGVSELPGQFSFDGRIHGMSDIFLSYTHDDRERVRPLVARLEARNWSVWWDRRILPGQHWPEVVQKALADCRAVVVIWTHRSVKSRWVRLEASAGSEINGLVPVRLDQLNDAHLPLEFRHIQAADLTDWDGANDHPELAATFEALGTILGVDESAPTLGSNTTLPLSLSLGGDLGSTDRRDLIFIDEQVREAGRRAVPALLAALEFPEPERRGHAAYLLGLTGDPKVVSALAPLLSDRAKVGIIDWLPTVRIAAARALKSIGTPEALQTLADDFE
jgi:TIR domain/PBS lyase HEAT-like repeat